MSTEGDLSDFDIHLIMEALSTRQSKVVASCALGIKLLLTEIQQQLLDLMVEGRLADTPVSHSSDGGEGDILDDPENQENTKSVENQKLDYENDLEDALSVAQEAVVTGATVPITGSMIKSPNPYPCQECSMIFSTKKALSRHLAKHDKSAGGSGDSGDLNEMAVDDSGLTSLPTPSKVLEETADDQSHQPLKIKLAIPKASPTSKNSQSGLRVTCPECGTQTLKHHMARHMLTHSNVKPFSCDFCTSTFTRKDKLKEHMKKHDDAFGLSFDKKPPRIKVSKCRKCGFETEDKELYKEHRKTHPSKMIYKCDDCGKEFHCPSHLEQHSIKHRNEKPFMCDMCGVSFSREPNLARHIRSHTNPAPFSCKFCNKPYHRNNELIVHERTHTGEKPYICEVCGNGYASSKYLKRHLFTHTGLKPFKCDLCDRAFARPENMKAHRKLHDKSSSRLPSHTPDAAAPTFHSSQLEATVGDDSVADSLNSPSHSVTDLYPFPNTAPLSIPNDVAVANRSSGGESIMQSFKISDDL